MRASLAAGAPASRRRIPRILSARPVLASVAERRSDSGLQRAARFPLPAPLAPSLPPFLPSPDLFTLEGGRWSGEEGGNLSPPPLPKGTTERAGLALVNSGVLCSGRLFPGHLTCQLLGKCCC